MIRFMIVFLSMVMFGSQAFSGSVCGGDFNNVDSVTSPFYVEGDINIGGTTLTPTDTEKYYMIFDHTQGKDARVIMTNTESNLGKPKPKPLIGVKPGNPWAAINYDKLPWGTMPSPSGQTKYVEVKVLHADHLSTALAGNTETAATKGVTSTTLVDNTYIYRKGTWDTGPIVPLDGLEVNNLFDPNRFGGQAFDLDRFRFAANKLWLKWQSDVNGGTNDAATDWHTKFGYQPTGTMSFEQFSSNVENNRPMFGIVRVVIPVTDKAHYSADYKTNCVDGNEFTGANAITCVKPPSDVASYVHSGNQVKISEFGASYGASPCLSKNIEVYGMLLYDYVTQATYSPTNFAGTNQDYADNAVAGTKNVRDVSNFYMKVYESVLVNQVNDHEKVVYSNIAGASHVLVAGSDGRMDSLEVARAHMKANTTPALSEVDDAYKFEYLMHDGLSDNDPNTPSANVLAYDFNAETLNAAARAEFATAWGSMEDKDKYHALFPSGYERGWMIAFDALDMTLTDWSALPMKAASTLGSANTDTTTYQPSWVTKSGTKTDYAAFKVPSTTLDIDVYSVGDTYYRGTGDDDPGNNAIPNTFTKQWEDFPGVAFADGVLDMHGHANISGMLYTPDTGEMETKGKKNAAFQYINGAILIAGGIFFEDACKSGDACNHSLIAVSYNPFAFDQLRTGSTVKVHKPKDIREIKGQ